MFGKNEQVGQAHFRDCRNLTVTSMFQTLQGEGPYSGQRAVFMRLAKCQLKCHFCDTYFDSGEEMSLELTYHRVQQCCSPTPHTWGLVITGGEPMLQCGITPFLELYHQNFKWTQIESNGLVLQSIPDHTTLVVSPKAAEDPGGKPLHYLKPPQRTLERADCLKFVIDKKMHPYDDIPDWAIEWRDKTSKRIYISPMNHYPSPPPKGQVVSFFHSNLDKDRNELNHMYAARLAMRYDVILSLQTHLYVALP